MGSLGLEESRERGGLIGAELQKFQRDLVFRLARRRRLARRVSRNRAHDAGGKVQRSLRPFDGQRHLRQCGRRPRPQVNQGSAWAQVDERTFAIDVEADAKRLARGAFGAATVMLRWSHCGIIIGGRP